VRRNEFSSTTVVSKRAGLIAVLSSSRTSVAVVRAGAAAARARARARGGRVVVVVARGRSVSNTSYEPIVRAPAKARGRTGAACDVVTPRASTRPVNARAQKGGGWETEGGGPGPLRRSRAVARRGGGGNARGRTAWRSRGGARARGGRIRRRARGARTRRRRAAINARGTRRRRRESVQRTLARRR